jgi:hypothetical protein
MVSDFMGCGDLRTLLFAGGQGLANSTFSHVGGLPDLFIECVKSIAPPAAGGTR